MQIETMPRCHFSSICENCQKRTTLGMHSLGESLREQTLSYVACGRYIWHYLSPVPLWKLPCLICEKRHQCEVVHDCNFWNRNTLETAQISRLCRGTPFSVKRNMCDCCIDVLSVKTAKHKTGCAVCLLVEKAEMQACVPAAVFV